MAEVGKREVRVDAFDKATGRTKYYEDLMPRDALYVRIKHSTIAHGFVKSVDKSAAEAIPGVVKVLTCFDVPEHPFPTAGHPWSMDPGHQDVADRHLLNRHVRYYGDDVAVVIAENEVAAMQGVRALQVEYEELPLVLDAQEAMKPGAPQLHEAFPSNILKHTDMKKGDYQAAIREPGLIKVEGWYDTPTVQHCHIENHGCFAYEENGRITVVASTQFRVNPNDVATAYYELRDPAGQLRSYMEDALRSAIPALSLDDAFARKDDVAFDVQKTVGAEMSRFGFTVVKTLITAIDPSPQVKNAMDSINAAQREKEATRQRAEAQRIQIETQAAADAEKTRLQGEGQANYRREIANGIVDQIKSLQAVGMNINDVNNVVLFNQYLDVMRSLSESNNTKTVVLPASTPGGYQDLYEQVTKAMLTASETK